MVFFFKRCFAHLKKKLRQGGKHALQLSRVQVPIEKVGGLWFRWNGKLSQAEKIDAIRKYEENVKHYVEEMEYAEAKEGSRSAQEVTSDWRLEPFNAISP